jgi:hypothetical protein
MVDIQNIFVFEKRIFKVRITTGIELLVLSILFLIVWRFTYVYSSGPISWDELWYMHISLNSEPFPKILNRYGHIYFQKFFFWIACDPFRGAKLFWSFLFSTTTALIYVDARMISENSSYLQGLISILIFFSLPIYLSWVGITYADFTVMMMVTFGVTLYLFYHRFHRYSRLILVLLGIILFFAVKSKESGIVLCILLAGLGFDESDVFDLGQFMRNVAFVLAGVLIGVLALMCLDKIFLYDALFSFRFAHMEELFKFNFGDYVRESRNWYSYVMSIAPAPFLLFIISMTMRRQSNFTAGEKVVWLLPVGLLMFLTFTMIRGRWGVSPRYCLPALPIIAILSSQIFDRETYGRTDGLTKQILMFFGSLAAVVVFYSFIGRHIDKYGWKLPSFQNAIILPIALSVLVFIVIFLKKWSFVIQLAAFTCILLLTVYPIYRNVHFLQREVYPAISEKRFAPLAAFSDRIVCSKKTKVFISKDLYAKYKILSRDIGSSRWMFNLYFDCDLKRFQFSYSSCADSLNDLLNGEYTYAYITKSDWDDLTHSVKEQLDAKYKREADNRIGVVFFWRQD